jgi:hypothetical protein
MADIALRSPQFKYKPIPATGVLSAVCTVTVDGTLRYTLKKNVVASTTVNFEVSELARDYLGIEYYSNFITQYVDIVTVLTNYAGLNGTGAAVGTATTFTDRGFESYGTFEEGVNPSFIGDRTNPTVLIAKDNITNSITPPTFTILTPTGKGGTVADISSSGAFGSVAYSTSATSITISGITINIKRIDCTKYGAGRKIIFINKFGTQQELWFFLKEVKSIGRTNEGYKSNTITYPITDNSATYSVNDAANKVFNTQAKQSHALSSGYYPEFANEFFEQLLLSEYVWMERLKKGTDTVEVIPVKVTSSSMTFKTSVNDRLIEYNMNFEEAFDYINNIR